jgi:hypothetical protein
VLSQTKDYFFQVWRVVILSSLVRMGLLPNSTTYLQSPSLFVGRLLYLKTSDSLRPTYLQRKNDIFILYCYFFLRLSRVYIEEVLETTVTNTNYIREDIRTGYFREILAVHQVENPIFRLQSKNN